MKRIIALFSVLIIVCSIFAACAQSSESTQESTESTQESTTESTTMRTTEDLATTFSEAQTNTIYDTLTKDADGSYPYEIASYTTKYQSSNETRTNNIHEAVEHLNNLKIPSGKVFSFNQTVGKRTVLSGYEEAKVVSGDEFVDGLGGGICQVSSTIFQAVLRSNLEIKVRACHSLEISYVPLGGDATVQWNSQDFQFVNSFDCDIRLKVTASDGTLTCTVWAKEDVDIGDVEINIEKDDDNDRYVLTRSVDGVINYTTYSKYSKAKTTTTTTKKSSDKKTTTKKSDDETTKKDD